MVLVSDVAVIGPVSGGIVGRAPVWFSSKRDDKGLSHCTKPRLGERCGPAPLRLLPRQQRVAGGGRRWGGPTTSQRNTGEWNVPPAAGVPLTRLMKRDTETETRSARRRGAGLTQRGAGLTERGGAGTERGGADTERGGADTDMGGAHREGRGHAHLYTCTCTRSVHQHLLSGTHTSAAGCVGADQRDDQVQFMSCKTVI